MARTNNESEDGVIKYSLTWSKELIAAPPRLNEILKCRTKLKEAGLIGVDANGVGYGNISVRVDETSFVISGSQTSGIADMNSFHFALVENYSFDKNRLTCRGLVKASSESLTHAALYHKAPKRRAVVHAHHSELWRTLYDKIPTTPKEALYGTPEIAKAIASVAKGTSGLVVMGGHQDGLIAFGESINQAASLLLSALSAVPEI